MSLSAAVIDAMVASGCSTAQIAAVVKADLAEREAAQDVKREKDAERQRRHRARNAESRDVTVTPCDTADSVTDPALSPAPNEINSNPHPHTHPDITIPCAREAFPKPEWCPDQVWRDLKANRKAKRLPCTATAHAKLLRDLDKLADDEWPPGRLLEAIVARGWAAAYDPRESSPDVRRQHSPVSKPTTRQIGEEVAASFARRGDGVVDLVPRLGAASGNDR